MLKIFHVFFLLAASLNGQGLKWLESGQKISKNVPLEKSLYTGEFKFQNLGDKPIKIISVKSNCGCLSSEFKNKVYKSQETGSIEFKVSLYDTGMTSKTILVDTDEKEGVEYHLIITLNKPEIKMTTKEKVARQRDLELEVANILKNRESYKIQKTCPYLPIPIQKRFVHDALGLRIYTCCPPCLDRLKKNPHEAVKKLALLGEIPIKVEQ